MKQSPLLRIILIAAVLIIALFILRKQPWKQKPVSLSAAAGGKRKVLEVGFLPVTCHLTCPVTSFASKTSVTGTEFDSHLYHDWPTVAEAFKSGRLQATFMLAPMAIKLNEEGVPCKIVYLGHRDGSTMMVLKNGPIHSLKDLAGKTVAIPSFESNQYLVLLYAMKHQGVNSASVHFVQMAPPDMPSALQTHAIDSYFVGEPFAGASQMAGYGKVLYYSYQLWPRFISCVLVVSDSLIQKHPDEVKDLVRGIADSGKWADTHRLQAAKLAAPYFRQNPKLLDFVLTNPPGRVKYEHLTPTDAEMMEIEKHAQEAGIINKIIPVSQFLDREFIPKHIVASHINMASAPTGPNNLP